MVITDTFLSKIHKKMDLKNEVQKQYYHMNRVYMKFAAINPKPIDILTHPKNFETVFSFLREAFRYAFTSVRRINPPVTQQSMITKFKYPIYIKGAPYLDFIPTRCIWESTFTSKVISL
jgi:hypothetical protein